MPTPSVPDSRPLSTLDPAAYDRFGVVLFAPPDVVAAVDALKEHLPRSGQPDLPAHVTVKNTFVAPIDLDAIAARVAECCASARPFQVVTGLLYDYAIGDRLGTIGFTVVVEPADAGGASGRGLHRGGRRARRPGVSPAAAGRRPRASAAWRCGTTPPNTARSTRTRGSGSFAPGRHSTSARRPTVHSAPSPDRGRPVRRAGRLRAVALRPPDAKEATTSPGASGRRWDPWRCS